MRLPRLWRKMLEKKRAAQPRVTTTILIPEAGFRVRGNGLKMLRTTRR